MGNRREFRAIRRPGQPKRWSRTSCLRHKEYAATKLTIEVKWADSFSMEIHQNNYAFRSEAALLGNI